MALLPRPYPDEVIGSVIARGARHSGLGLSAFYLSIYGTKRSHSSFLMGSDFKRLGALSGTDPEELLLSHTVFPYATAFMPTATKGELVAKALSLDTAEECIGSLTKNITHGAAFRRFCPSCAKADLGRYGESYWRRRHLLPASFVCLEHGTNLLVTNVHSSGRAQPKEPVLPHAVQVEGQARGRTLAANNGQHFSLTAFASPLPVHLTTPLAGTQLTSMAKISVDALGWNVDLASDLRQQYREQAIALGYQMKSGDVAGKVMSGALENFFGAGLLEDTGCPMTDRSPWPAQMVRPGVGVPFATTKHVLMRTFLEDSSPVTAALNESYGKPGKKTRDFKRYDTRLLAKLANQVKKAKERNERLTVKELLTRAGSWQVYRHQREMLPKCAAFVAEFRNSEQSERQLGVREYWRKRFPKRYGSTN